MTTETLSQVIKPRVRGFICVTAHPVGCTKHVQEQIDYVTGKGPIKNAAKNVLVIGSSTGYGLASRITAAFGGNAQTIGVFFEKPSENGKPASAGWYNNVAFEKAARAKGLYAKSINGDAFSDEIKQQTIDLIKKDLGKVDLVVYSLASPRRKHPKTGAIYNSVLKPIGSTAFTAKTLDTDKEIVKDITIEPANEQEVADTVAVMGGEDWQMWIDALEQAGVLADGATTCAYSYIGPKVTWPIYYAGSIGQAKQDLQDTANKLNSRMKSKGGRAFISINKALVTQASSAIPVVPLYISLLYKVMKEKNLHEGCIEQMYRLFATQMYNDQTLKLDEEGRVRIDDWEMSPEVQDAVNKLWSEVTTENLKSISDFENYKKEFLKLFGFGLPGVDYDKPVDLS
jgi:enoyl-[acyl-carrier protein] reductase/trans-2-enoyl-CoA reductase (NAD+)